MALSSGKGADEVYATIRMDGRLVIGGFRSKNGDFAGKEDATDLGPGDELAKAALEDWMRSKFPALLAFIEESGGWGFVWKGQISLTVDGIPLAGTQYNLPISAGNTPFL